MDVVGGHLCWCRSHRLGYLRYGLGAVQVIRVSAMMKAAAGVGVVVAAFLIASVVTHGLSSGWDATEWGPVAAWFSGFLTVAAVGVALYQTIMARRDTEIARAEAAQQVATARADAEAQRLRAVEERALAEARHAQQLQNSEDLLARQLDAQRRAEQVATLPPIWAAIGNLQQPFHNYVQFLEYDLVELVDMEDKQAAADKLEEAMMPFQQLLMNLELVFMPAQMIVGEEHVFDAVNDLYEETRLLSEMCSALLFDNAYATSAPDTTELKACFTRIVQQRKVMTRIVREHLSQVPPLTRKFPGTEGYESTTQHHNWKDI